MLTETGNDVQETVEADSKADTAVAHAAYAALKLSDRASWNVGSRPKSLDDVKKIVRLFSGEGTVTITDLANLVSAPKPLRMAYLHVMDVDLPSDPDHMFGLITNFWVLYNEKTKREKTVWEGVDIYFPEGVEGVWVGCPRFAAFFGVDKESDKMEAKDLAMAMDMMHEVLDLPEGPGLQAGLVAVSSVAGKAGRWWLLGGEWLGRGGGTSAGSAVIFSVKADRDRRIF